MVVPDCLRSAVTKAHTYDPEINRTYVEMCHHYGVVAVPARVRKPRDKAKVENGVLIVERWILFRLRKRVFTSLDELNHAIRDLLIDLNNRPFQKLPGSRRSQYEAIDRPALKPLPVQRYEYTEFRRVRVGLDGLFDIDGCPYSAPFALCREEIDVRLTTETVEILHRGRRIGSHVRSTGTAPVIDPQHQTATHRYFGTWEPGVELEWAAAIGPNTRAFLGKLLAQVRIKEIGIRAAGAMKNLKKEFGAERLEAACMRAIEIEADSISSVRSILRTRLDQQAQPESGIQEAAFEHCNVRGSDYYH